MTDLKPSVRATYDSSVTGPRYTVTTMINGRFDVDTWRQPIHDPFVRQTVTIGWRDILRGLLKRRLTVEVTIGGVTADAMYDVLELDDQTLIRGRTRHAAFQQSMHGKLRTFGEGL